MGEGVEPGGGRQAEMVPAALLTITKGKPSPTTEHMLSRRLPLSWPTLMSLWMIRGWHSVWRYATPSAVRQAMRCRDGQGRGFPSLSAPMEAKRRSRDLTCYSEALVVKPPETYSAFSRPRSRWRRRAARACSGPPPRRSPKSARGGGGRHDSAAPPPPGTTAGRPPGPAAAPATGRRTDRHGTEATQIDA